MTNQSIASDLPPSKPGFSLFSPGSSLRLRLISGYFMLVGFLGAIVGPLSVLFGVWAVPAFAGYARAGSHRLLLGLGQQVLVFAGWLLAGLLLARRRKQGALVAFLVLLYQIIGSVDLSVGKVSLHLVLGVTGMILILAVLKELR
jgi:hypothetical protein